MTDGAIEQAYVVKSRSCPRSTRKCLCLKQAILGICSEVRAPRTTAEFVRALELGSMDIYSALFAMQFEGLIDCHEAQPWTWTLTGKGEALLQQRHAAACQAA